MDKGTMDAELLMVSAGASGGQAEDEAAARLSRVLPEIGINILRRASSGSRTDEIGSAVSEALARSRLVIVTGSPGRAGAHSARPDGREDGHGQASAVYEALLERGETVCFAESCTGGRLAAGLIDCPGASGVLRESYVTYADEAKERILGVRGETLARKTAVSGECAREMAEGARRVSGSDWAVASTGYAGPDGGTADCPVGTVFLAVAGPNGTAVRRFLFSGDRDRVRTLACVNGWSLLLRAIGDARQC